MTQALFALLEVVEAEEARANGCVAEDMPPAHDLRPSVVEIKIVHYLNTCIIEEKFQSSLGPLRQSYLVSQYE